ncbi:MAG: hypothetical protein V4607_05355 [Pseudomonadota bacterium]
MSIRLKRIGFALLVSAMGAALPTSVLARPVQNTAAFSFSDRDGGTLQTQPSNTVSFNSVPAPTPSHVVFSQYSPGNAGATPTAVDGGQCANSAGAFSPAPAAVNYDGQAINTSNAVPLAQTTQFHAGQPVFITLTDSNRNLDPAVRDSVELTISTSNGDQERLRLLETDINTGIFAGYIPSSGIPPTLQTFDCKLSATPETKLTVSYTDIYYNTDHSSADALFDPYGRVFDSQSGALINGATVSIVNAANGQAAIVFCDDGVTRCPSTVISGASGLDGTYRFPLMASGDYRILVTPPAGYLAPSTAPQAQVQALRDPQGNPFDIESDASYQRPFTLVGPVLSADIPIDPQQTTLTLQKTSNVAVAAIGDFVQWQLTLGNSGSTAVTQVVIVDTLPLGLRYRAGSIRFNGQTAAEPVVSADGRTLRITVPTLAAAASIEIRYVTIIGAGIKQGDVINLAAATAAGGANSNQARATLRVQSDFFDSTLTLIGRVVDGECSTEPQSLKGMPGIRLLLEDGTYVVTDNEGLFHFEGLRAGTHVVQIDLDSVPPDFEVIPCIRNSRFAGRSFSQFVDQPGGGLWRTDFHVRKRAPLTAPVGIRMLTHTSISGDQRILQYRLELDGAAVPLKKLRTLLQLPAGASYIAGSSRLDGKAVTDPQLTEDVLSFSLGDPGSNWKQVLEFSAKLAADAACSDGFSSSASALFDSDSKKNIYTPRVQTRIACPAPSSTLKFEPNIRFDSLQAEIRPDQRRKIDAMVEALKGQTVESILATGDADGLRIPPESAAPFASNETLALARAKTVGNAVASGIGLPQHQVEARTVDRSQPPRGAEDDEQGRAINRSVKQVEARIASKTVADDASSRMTVQAVGAANTTIASAVPPRPLVLDAPTAAGAGRDWLALAGAQVDANGNVQRDFLFPAEGFNPRSPGVRVVLAKAPKDGVTLKLNGVTVDPLTFEATQINAQKTAAFVAWNGVILKEGDNIFTAEISDAEGAPVSTLRRVVHYSGQPLKAELIAAQSYLRADGINRPTLALRFTDADGRPIRAGVTGAFEVQAPYQAAETVDQQQRRQLAGMDGFAANWQIAGDDGIAYIELAPTTNSGSVLLKLNLGDPRNKPLEIRSWLDATKRDWVVVGFAEGTVGFKTLSKNVEALKERGTDDKLYSNGQVSFYAKGQILGKWLLTLAYDSAKDSGTGQGVTSQGNGQTTLRNTIDPNRYYLLYGDGSQQRYDAASQSKLYVKLERNQFYALFGDFETGMNSTELTRYNRVFNGIKSEYNDGRNSVTVFAADTAQNYARDEFRGNGTSGLYRLSVGNIVLGSESIRLETRDRLRSEVIVSTQPLTRDVDYTLDSIAGTLFFRQPVLAHDAQFNPVFIVAEYETEGDGKKQLNAGARGTTQLLDGKLTIGASYLRDSSQFSKTDLGGIDLKLRTSESSELRLEAAHSSSNAASGAPPTPINADNSGNAWLAEWSQHGKASDLLLYGRRQDNGFGVDQQNASESGTQKFGGKGRLRLSDQFAFDSEVFQQELLGIDAKRNFADGKLAWRGGNSGVSAGLQYARDELPTAPTESTKQITLGANTALMGGKLELLSQNEIGIGQSTSSSFPTRYLLQAAYKLTPWAKLILADEYADGDKFNYNTLRFGTELLPWKGAVLDSTLNQQNIQEYGPRTFANFGLAQNFLIDDHWGVDAHFDSVKTLVKSQPIPADYFAQQDALASTALNGGSSGNTGLPVANALTEDYNAISLGTTYRAEIYSWNIRAEHRSGEYDKRDSITSSLLRQARAGIASAGTLQWYQASADDGGLYTVADASLALAYRPLGGRWSLLDRFRLNYQVQDGSLDIVGSQLTGSSNGGSTQTRKIINNLALNFTSKQWSDEDRQGNLFTMSERTQASLYYGAKYVISNIDGAQYRGFTDLIGFDARHDLSPKWDIGLQASTLHVWATKTLQYSVGPNIGYSPVANSWVTLGYNVLGFIDQDFDAAQYSAAGPYLKLRFKFDQQTRIPGLPSLPHAAPKSSETPVRVVDLNEAPTAAGKP